MVLITPCFLFDGEMNVFVFFRSESELWQTSNFSRSFNVKTNAVNENNISTYIEIKDIYFFTFYQKKRIALLRKDSCIMYLKPSVFQISDTKYWVKKFSYICYRCECHL